MSKIHSPDTEHLGIIKADCTNKIQRPVNKKIIPEKLIEYVKEYPDAYLRKIAEVFGCHSSSVLKRLRKRGITRKKRVHFTKNKTRKKKNNIWSVLKTFLRKNVYISMSRCTANMHEIARGAKVKIGISGKRHCTGLVAVQCEDKLIALFK